MKALRTIVLLLVLTASGAADLLAQGCSMCKAVVSEGEANNGHVFGGEQAIGSGLNSGIIIMMIVPYVLLFLFFRKKLVGFWKEFSSAQG
ncbi:MAG TPA: hypothetical protein VGE21_01665 [Flavobacteriales bacterium]